MPKRRKLKAAASALPVKRCKTAEELPFKAPPKVSKAKMSKVKILATPEKSENDKKEYRVIELENGLKCLLIADLAYPLEKLDEEEAEEELDVSDEEGEEDPRPLPKPRAKTREIDQNDAKKNRPKNVVG